MKCFNPTHVYWPCTNEPVQRRTFVPVPGISTNRKCKRGCWSRSRAVDVSKRGNDDEPITAAGVNQVQTTFEVKDYLFFGATIIAKLSLIRGETRLNVMNKKKKYSVLSIICCKSTLILEQLAENKDTK
jgi:hypothetical protein